MAPAKEWLLICIHEFADLLSAKFSWAQLDVTRRSIEETAAAVLKLFTDRQRQRLPE